MANNQDLMEAGRTAGAYGVRGWVRVVPHARDGEFLFEVAVGGDHAHAVLLRFKIGFERVREGGFSRPRRAGHSDDIRHIRLLRY